MYEIFKKITKAQMFKLLPTENGILAINKHYDKDQLDHYKFTYDTEKDKDGYVTLSLGEVMSLSANIPEVRPEDLIKDIKIDINETILNNEEAIRNLHPMSLDRVMETMAKIIMERNGEKTLKISFKA